MAQSPSIRIVEASAGSGKTYRLTLQFVYLLLLSGPNSFNLKNILAITFTNDAANVMKRRILEWLKKAALRDAKTLESIRKFDAAGALAGLSDDAIARRSLDKVSEILENYGDFNVQTIDSFINAIALSSSLEIGLPPRYDIVPDPSAHIEYVIDDVLSGIKKGSAASKIFDDFIESYLNVEKETGWSPKKMIFENICFLNDNESIYGRKFAENKLLAGSLKRTGDNIKNDLLKFASECEDSRTAESLRKKAQRHAFDEITPNQMEMLPPALTKKLAKYFETLSSARLNAYIKIYGLIRDRLNEYKTKNGIIFISDLNLKINEYLKTGNVPEIYFMLGDKINHYLIDEFQDTSEIQWNNLSPMIENALAGGGTLFYVGDKKQALYRFRGGEVRLFDEAAGDFPSTAMAKEYLGSNFRSRRNIVEFNNAIFSPENLKKVFPDNEILSAYSNVRQDAARLVDREGGFVSVKKIYTDGTREELDDLTKRHVLEIMANVCGRYNYDDIALLVRKNEDVRKMTLWLLDAGYPVISEITISIRENRLINETINFLRFLGLPADDLAFASFIFGDIFCAASKMKKDELSEFFKASRDRAVPLSDLFREKHASVWNEYVEEFLKISAFMPLYDLVHYFMCRFRVLENFPGSEGFFMRLLEILNEMDASRRNSIKSFLDYWDIGAPDEFQVALPKFTGAVNVSTIHKAKGLSYPVVILPFLPAAKTVNKFVVKNKSLSLRYITKDYKKFSPKLKSIYDKNLADEAVDDLNSLYVGLTRAESELYVLILESKKIKNPFSSLFEECVISHGDVKIERSKKPLPSLGKLTPKAALTPAKHWGERISREKIKLNYYSDPARKKLVDRGNFMHYVLSQIDILGDDIAGTVTEKVSVARTELNYNGDAKEVAETLTAALKTGGVMEWFSKHGFNEKEIVDSKGNIIRPDRIIVDEDRIKIIEYKTGEEYDDAHRSQVKNYMKNVSAVYPSARVEGFLFYVDERRIVEVAGD